MNIHSVRHLVIAALAGAAVGAAAAPAAAQAQDDRWTPWFGCWQAVPAPDAPAEAARVVCVTPAGDAARVFTLAGGVIVTRDLIQPGDSARPITQDGCSGTERVRWAADGARLFRTAELECQGGLHESVSQILAISRIGEWIDAQGVTIQSRAGARALRLREVPAPAGLPDEVTLAMAAGRSGLARIAAGAPVTMDAVVEASKEAAPGVVAAWLLASGQPFALDGRRLLRLSRAGVPGEVTDAMVALTYPRVFALNPANPKAEPLPESASYGSGPAYGGMAPAVYGYSNGYCYDPRNYLIGGCYDALGFGAEYGLGYYGRWNWNSRPVIVLSNSGGPTAASQHGRVVKSEGYRPGAGAPSGSVSGRPRTDPPSGGSGSGSRVDGGSNSSAGSSGASGSAGGAAPLPASEDRTAKPRP